MATMPSRADTAPRAIASILAQVDRLWLFLDRFDVIPAYAEHERIHVLRTVEVGDIRANGKLAGLARETTPCTFFSVDDDVEYPADYCDTLESQLASYDGGAAVGVHAAILSPPVSSYLRDMAVLHRRASLDDATEVDLLGTDSTAFRTSALRFDVREWEHVNLVDLSFALAARRESVPLVAIPRAKGWVSPLAERQDDSIWLGVRRDDTKQTALAQDLLALPRPRLAPPEVPSAGALSSERRLSRHAGVPVLRVRELRHREVLLRVRVGARRSTEPTPSRGAEGRDRRVRRSRRLDGARREARSGGRPRDSVALPCTIAA